MPNDLILGYPFLTRFMPRIDWRARVMQIKQGKRMYIIPGLQLHEKHLESIANPLPVSTPETSSIYNIIYDTSHHPTMMNEKVSSFTYLHPVDLTPTEKDAIIQEAENISTSVPKPIPKETSKSMLPSLELKKLQITPVPPEVTTLLSTMQDVFPPKLPVSFLTLIPCLSRH